jgi:hypothetical protein
MGQAIIANAMSPLKGSESAHHPHPRGRCGTLAAVEEQLDNRSGSSPQAGRPKVIYVMGAGRSGSTILGVALGNCADVFFAGELDRWLARAGVPRREGAELARFWSVVREHVEDAPELAGGRATCLERSSALLDIRKLPARRRLRPAYRRVSEELYRAIKLAAGATHVVDTSHYPMRARELQSLSGIELYLVLLVRDPQSVIASLDRDDVPERRFAAPTANAYLWLTHALSLLVFLRHPRERRLFVRHEDFLSDPQRILRRVLLQTDSSAEPPDLSSLDTGVPFHGNRLIASERVALEPRDVSPARRSCLTAAVQFPWLALFSRLRPAASAS